MNGMHWVSRFFRFWYDFIIGDDWRIAAGVSVALIVTYVLAHNGFSQAWIVLPVIVAVGLTMSLWRATRRLPS